MRSPITNKRCPDPIETYSRPNPQAQATLETIFSRLEQAMQKLDPPATNEFNPPATLDQIAMLEQILKMPLPAEFVPILSATTDNQTAPRISQHQRLLPIDQILDGVRPMAATQSLGTPRRTFDFDPDTMQLKIPTCFRLRLPTRSYFVESR